MSPTELARFLLESPSSFLSAVDSGAAAEIDLDRVDIAQVWALVGMASLGRREQSPHAQILHRGESGASRFAHAIGLDDVVGGYVSDVSGEAGRTVRLQRVRQRFDEVEPAASKVSRLVVPDDEDVRRTLYYVIVELLRNVVQHSGDPLGGVVAAQRMDAAQHYEKPMIQVAVGDTGRGILEALRTMHPGLTDPQAALEKALQPHISGTFEEGQTGAPSGQNAGLGLFFIAEMAKRTAGRLLIASRGACLLLDGDPAFGDQHRLRFVEPVGVGFPGTLVAFELPVGGVDDYDGLIQVINAKGRERIPQRAVHRWIRFEDAPPGVFPLLVDFKAENTAAAAELAADQLMPRVIKRQPLALDFRNLQVCTQSYLHALLAEVVRAAWAFRVPIYVVNARPAVRSGLELLEGYALGG